MDQTRKAARQLVEQGKIEITQRGKAVDSNNFKGPIRLRNAAPNPEKKLKTEE